MFLISLSLCCFDALLWVWILVCCKLDQFPKKPWVFHWQVSGIVGSDLMACWTVLSCEPSGQIEHSSKHLFHELNSNWLGDTCTCFLWIVLGKHFHQHAVAVSLYISGQMIPVQAFTCWWCCSSVVRMTSKRCGSLFLLFLVMGTSMFISSTSLLPSSFAMYMLTGAATSVLDRKPVKVIAFAVILVTWGWPVAGKTLALDLDYKVNSWCCDWFWDWKHWGWTLRLTTVAANCYDWLWCLRLRDGRESSITVQPLIGLSLQEPLL